MAKVSLKDQLGRVIKLDAQATSGATVGKDLRWPNGTVVKESELKQSTSAGTTVNASPTLWKLIREIPANIQKLAALAGTGWATRQSDGEWSLRTLQAGDGIEVENGDADAGDPIISLAPAIRVAASTVSALRVVTESSAGVSHLDPTDDEQVAGLLGVSISAGDAGDEIRIKTGGTIDDAGWSWVPGFVYAGPNGTLTQTYPASGWEIVIGYAPSATRLNLTFDEPVKLA